MAEIQIVGDEIEVVAEDVSFEQYMEQYAEHFTEWVEGKVIKMPPVTEDHDFKHQFLILLLRLYLDATGEGTLHFAPFVMKVSADAHAREPDLQIVLAERAGILKPTMTAGPADIAIEIVSKESVYRDIVTKFDEYQAGGVREYWLINPLRKHADFYVLGEDKLYKRIELRDGVFQSTVLKHFRLQTNLLWQDPLPKGTHIMAMVAEMVKEE